ncbi:MAG: HAD-IC family P-type ATPase, partial [Patescibacteria group bacterium]|nr:HAD-IC family P-type ATPase [Patescibacteria group bacterium]
MSDYHSKKAEACFKKLKSNINGLSSDEAEKRLKKNGFNEFTEEKPISKALIFLSQFNSVLVYILLLVGSISLVLKSYIDASVIFTAVVINIIIGYIQENKANSAIQKLKKLVEHKAVILRDSQEIFIDSRLVAAGDIIIISAGNRIPADARLFEVADLSVNESMLTGESMPSDKNINLLPEGAALADR